MSKLSNILQYVIDKTNNYKFDSFTCIDNKIVFSRKDSVSIYLDGDIQIKNNPEISVSVEIVESIPALLRGVLTDKSLMKAWFPKNWEYYFEQILLQEDILSYYSNIRT